MHALMTMAQHHGDLADRLVTAALAILARDGLAGLSLRAVARAAGVSAMAPYHHFADRTALLAAVATEGFDRLYAAKMAAIGGIDEPGAALVAGSRAYVRFVIDNPALYRLMKGPELAERSAHPALAAAAARPAASLAALLHQLGKTPDAAIALWALVHGFGLLAIDGYLGGLENADGGNAKGDRLVERAGWAAQALLDGLK